MSKKIIKDRTVENASNVSLRDILLNDLLSETEREYYCRSKGDIDNVCKFNLFMDAGEGIPTFTFNLMVGGRPAAEKCSSFFVSLVPGRGNDKGFSPIYIDCIIKSLAPLTIVELTIPAEHIYNAFSNHENGYSYSNYALYGRIATEAASNMLFSKGKIYKTDVITDAVENGKM